MREINNIADIVHEMPNSVTKEEKAKVNEAIARSLSFCEGFKKHKDSFRNNPTIGVDTAKELGFSEQSIDAIESLCQSRENKTLEFAGYDNDTQFVGNWTTGTLNILAQEVGSSLDPNFALSLEFPDKAVPMWNVIIDRIKGTSGILPEADGDTAPIPTVPPLDTYGMMFQPGLWGARTPIGAKDIFFGRKRGGGGFDERGIAQIVAYNTVNLMSKSFARKKQTLSDAIFKNGFTYAGANISSNIPASNFVPMQPIGTLNPDGSVTYDTSDPYYNPFISITNLVNNPVFYKFRQYIIGILVSAADLQAIMNHPQVRAVSNILMAGSTSLGKRTLNVQIGDLSRNFTAFYAPGFDIPLIADAEQWQSENLDGTTDNNTRSNLIVPRGYMKVMLDLSSFGAQQGAFHLTYNQFDPNIEMPAMGYFQGVFPRNLVNSDNTNRIDIVGSLSGAPAVYMPEAQFIITGLYDNVPDNNLMMQSSIVQADDFEIDAVNKSLKSKYKK